MRKITKILTTFALCGLFTFTNTSGIEEKTLALKSAVSSDNLNAGQWYKLDHEQYDDFRPTGLPLTQSFIFNGSAYFDIIDYSQPGPYNEMLKISSFVLERDYIGYELSQEPFTTNTIFLENLLNNEQDFYICFSIPPVASRFVKSFFLAVDNDNFSSVCLDFDINLISSKFQPLIYLNRLITDNIYVAFPFGEQAFNITIFTGSFYSNNKHYDKIVLQFYEVSGQKYSLDNGLTTKTFPNNAYICNFIGYQLGNGPLYGASQQKYTNVDNVNVFLGLSYRYAGDELLLIESYKNEFPNEYMPNLNSLELINLRPNDGSGIITDDSDVLGSAFNLLGLVFTSLAGFLNFAIFPGITLGLLLIIPIIITLIIVIFKVVN